jgi:hypothetical protein
LKIARRVIPLAVLAVTVDMMYDQDLREALVSAPLAHLAALSAEQRSDLADVSLASPMSFLIPPTTTRHRAEPAPRWVLG